MTICSDHPNAKSSLKVRLASRDVADASRYHPNMARKASPPAQGPDWFLREWMAALKVRQTDLARMTGWSKATMSDIYNGRTAFYREMLNTIALALDLKPHELLMHPDDAIALRQLRGAAAQIAAVMPAEESRRDGTTG